MKSNYLVRIITFIVLLCLTFGCCWLYSKTKNIPEIACYDQEEVFNKFSFKKEMEIKLKKVQESRARIIDSVLVDLRVMSNQLNPKSDRDVNIFQEKKDNYDKLNNQFLEDNQRMIESYNEQIFKQMNSFMKEYIKENNINLLFAYSPGDLKLNVNNADDHTLKLIEYLNKKYEGK